MVGGVSFGWWSDSACRGCSEAWAEDYHETVVHWALVEKGFELWLHPGSQVWQARSDLTLATALRERYVWGRSFAGTRAQTIGSARCVVYAALSFLLPFILDCRASRNNFSMASLLHFSSFFNSSFSFFISLAMLEVCFSKFSLELESELELELESELDSELEFRENEN